MSKRSRAMTAACHYIKNMYKHKINTEPLAHFGELKVCVPREGTAKCDNDALNNLLNYHHIEL